MPKLPLILVAVAFALTGAVTAAQAQGKTKAKGKDRATCTNLVRAYPGMLVANGRNCTVRCHQAIARCMRGGPIS